MGTQQSGTPPLVAAIRIFLMLIVIGSLMLNAVYLGRLRVLRRSNRPSRSVCIAMMCLFV